LLDSQPDIHFDVPAVLRKKPSVNGQPTQHVDWPNPYLVFDGTLRECIAQLLTKPEGQRHLYEIHIAGQGDHPGKVLTSSQIADLELLRKRIQ